MRQTRPPVRRDGWTVDRQVRFLEVLRCTRSVSKAAHAVGMSRESAHRLRKRDPNSLFAVSWARIFPPRLALSQAQVDQGHRLLMALACYPERIGLPATRAARSTR